MGMKTLINHNNGAQRTQIPAGNQNLQKCGVSMNPMEITVGN